MDQAQQHELDMISDLRKRSARWKLGAIGVTAITIFTTLIPFISVTNGGAFQTVPQVWILAGMIFTSVCVWQTVELRGEAARRETQLWG